MDTMMPPIKLELQEEQLKERDAYVVTWVRRRRG